MRKSNEQRLQDVISDLLDGSHLKTKMIEVNLVNDWHQIVGPLIAKHTTKVYVSNGKLVLYIDSAPLRNELQYSRSKLVELVNEYAKMELIHDVMVK